MIRFLSHRRELLIWTAGLLWLAWVQPSESHFTFCPLSNLGMDFCPGCGLGRSISYLFRWDIVASWQQHPLGVFALLVLLLRIKKLLTQPVL